MSQKKRENFKRIAESRTNKIIKGISSLGNLSNKSYYEYTSAEIKAVFDAIQTELDEQRQKFIDLEKPKKKFRL